MKRYMDMSDEELKELQFVLLVELQKLVCCKHTGISDLSARHSSLHFAGDKCPCACGRGIASNRQATLCSTICASQRTAISEYGFLLQVWVVSKSFDLVQGTVPYT